MRPHIRHKIVFIYVFQSRSQVLFVKNVPYPVDIRMPLREALVKQASFADLVFYFARFVVPVRLCAFETVKISSVGKVQLLAIPFAVEQILLAPFLPFQENAAAFFGHFRLA